MCILGTLSTKFGGMTNANKILNALPRTQSPDRLKERLEELCILGMVQKVDMSAQHEGLINWKITPRGEKTLSQFQSTEYDDVKSVLYFKPDGGDEHDEGI